MNNNNVVVALFNRDEAVELELDTLTLMHLGALRDQLGAPLNASATALENLAMRQTLDDLQQLVWP